MPYPGHLARYPYGLIPRSRRRRRGHGLGWYVYLGSHPVLTLIGLAVNAYLLALVLGWIALVTVAWLLWSGAVGAWWLVTGAR